MTLLVTSITAQSLDELTLKAEQAWAGGAEAVEIRIDNFRSDHASLAKYLAEHKDRAWIVTCRSAAEGGQWTGDAKERVRLLTTATRGTNAYIDFELADWKRSQTVRKQLTNVAVGSDGRGRLILSAHHFDGVPPNLAEVVHELRRVAPGAVAKVAYQTRDITDSFAALDLMYEYKQTVIAVAMGEPGLWSRILARKLGAFASYCCLSDEAATAPGQLTLDEMLHHFRWKEINRETKVFGVLGDPVEHSMSPLIFNRWFADAGINAVYLPLRVDSRAGGLDQFLSNCVTRPWLDVRGFSVTIPHKQNALRWVNERADRLSRSIGAVNTLMFREGKVTGYNTDCYAVVDSLVEALGCERGDLAGLPIDVLGTGGAARAATAGLREYGCAVTVYGRSPTKTDELARTFSAHSASWEKRIQRKGEVLINCTSVGMARGLKPAALGDESPMPPDAFSGCRLVFDFIYHPLQTRLLRDAAAAGAATLNGLDMFIRQAVGQFTLWTSKTPNQEVARRLVMHRIQQQIQEQS